jgi:hypothetical protein
MAMNYTLLVNYILCMLFGMMIFLIPMRNYLITWIKVKLPFFKSADIQVRIKRSGSDYFAIGSYDNGQLWYMAKKRKDNTKPWRKLDVSQEDYNNIIYRSNGVSCIDVDDVKNCVLNWNGTEYKSVKGFNAEASAEVVFTALQKPSTENQGLFSPIVRDILICLIVVVVAGSTYLIIKRITPIDAHLKMIYDYVKPMADAMNVTMIQPSIGG